jgi:predicted enzyme related to lactoylglutathione lyase
MKELINWFEIPANDIKRAVKFYSTVLQMELEAVDYGTEKMACFPDGYNISGAISQHKDLVPSPNGVMISFHAGDNMTGFLERVVLAGGEIRIPKTKIESENRGYFATFKDSEGNLLSVYSDN